VTDLHAADGTDAHVPRRLAPCGCERCRAEAAALEEQPCLIVENRLGISLDLLANARRLARLADASTGLPLVSNLRPFARFVRDLTRGVERHLLAIKAVLPVSATNLDAPDWKEGA